MKFGRLDNLNKMTNTPIENDIIPSVGQLLKATRLARGLTLEAAAKSLCLSKRQLSQLEEDEENLVCDVYTLGFLRLYAQYLQLDKEEITKKFKDQAFHPKLSPLTFPAPLPGRGIPSFRILGLSLIALLVIIGGWQWIGHEGAEPPSEEEIVFTHEVPETNVEPETPLHVEPTALLPIQQTPFPNSPILEVDQPLEEENHPNEDSLLPVQTATLPGTVVLTATEDSWIEVKDEDGKIILSRLFQAGDSYTFNNPQKLILKTGNVGGIRLTAGERVHDLSGKSGEVRSGILLDPEKWLEQSPETD